MSVKIKLGKTRYQPIKGRPDTFDCFVSMQLMVDDVSIARQTLKVEQNFAREDAKDELADKIKEEAIKWRNERVAKDVLSQSIDHLKEKEPDLFE